MEEIKSKILNSLPARYKLEWGMLPNSPIRFKTVTTKETAQILNDIWAKIISKYTNSDIVHLKKYKRICVVNNDETVAISMFPNNTIMFQGNQAASWMNDHIEEIARKVENEIEDRKTELDQAEESDLSSTSLNLQGMCAICDQKDNL